MPKIPRVTPMPFPSENREEDNITPEPRENVAAGKVEEIDSGFIGQRKLVRPVMPESATAHRDTQRKGFRGMLSRREIAQPAATPQDHSNAEAFYFQKQMQAQTQMVFVLEDGEHVEGYIEWYDRNCIKVRNSGRVLIYKSAIKYLYKASERQNHFQPPFV